MMTMHDILNLKNACLGFVMNNDGDEFPAVLRDTGDQIELSILKRDDGQAIEKIETAVNNEEQDLRIGKEFGICIEFKADYPYTLIGREGSSYGTSSDVGVVTLIPERVIARVACKDFDTVDGMLTSMDGLSQWLGLSCFRWGNEGLKQTLTVEDTPETAMELSGELSYVQKWFIQPRQDSAEITNRVYLKTFLPQASWSEHLRIHDLISELMSVADCCTHGYRNMKVCKVEADVSTSKEIGRDKWHDVLSYNPVVDRNGVDCVTIFLFTYDDLSEDGISRWSELRSECSQGMVMLLYLIREFDNLAIETEAMLVGAMLECVGWYIVKSKKQTHRMKPWKDRKTETKRVVPKSFEDMLNALLEEFGNLVPLNDIENWKDCMHDAYIGNKHPDAGKAELDETRLVVMESMILVRMWVGMQVGVDLKKMKGGLGRDRIGRLIRSHLA